MLRRRSVHRRIWRALRRLVDEGRLEVSGRARATGYSLAGAAVVRAYLQTPYNRRKLAVYRKEFVDSYVPDKIFYLNDGDRQCLHDAGRPIPLPLPTGHAIYTLLQHT